jgi:hypothetical protein
MNTNNFRNPGNRGVRRFAQNRASLPNQVSQNRQLLAQTRKTVQNDGVRRLPVNSQTVSVPNHNFQLKIQRKFRIYSRSGAAALALTTENIRNAVRQELGVEPSATTHEQFSVHRVDAYSTGGGTGGGGLTVSVYNSEENGTGQANQIALFEDIASSAGVNHIAFEYSLSSRPTFNDASPTVVFLRVSSAPADLLVIDLLVTYIRTPSAVPTAVVPEP